ncbi:MAG: hypothetical protein JO291_07720, partial [Acidimicrobiia bacterium]|nr:hypothetical protein [Acidimicrobiia bacterium]
MRSSGSSRSLRLLVLVALLVPLAGACGSTADDTASPAVRGTTDATTTTHGPGVRWAIRLPVIGQP